MFSSFEKTVYQNMFHLQFRWCCSIESSANKSKFEKQCRQVCANGSTHRGQPYNLRSFHFPLCPTSRCSWLAWLRFTLKRVRCLLQFPDTSVPDSWNLSALKPVEETQMWCVVFQFAVCFVCSNMGQGWSLWHNGYFKGSLGRAVLWVWMWLFTHLRRMFLGGVREQYDS